MVEKREKLKAPADKTKVNLLLVDDRADGLLVLESVLASPDYHLVKARSGSEALALLETHEFAVILLDVQMPEMDGFQTATLIKQKPAAKDVPILFVTAIHKDTPYIYQGYEVGAVDYIFKPFDPYILRSKVAVFVELFRRNMRIQEAQDELRRKEEELYQARKLEAIGRLAGGVAHDFNNIIAGILGISEEMRELLEPSDAKRQDLDEIIKATHRAFSLTRQLLAYARRQIISPTILNLNDVVLDMREMLARLIGEDIRLNTDLESRLDAIRADRGYLEQVLVNLVLNARDAMPQGGTVAIKTANVQLKDKAIGLKPLELSPGPYVLLAVSDAGCGMNKEVLDHVFEPFFTTKEKDKGTGLGLATVYGIVKQNGGDIAVHSQPEFGTRMEIYFPRVTHEIPETRIEKAAPAVWRGSETILVAEDERLVRRVVTTLLRKNGYNVLEAANGPQALAICEKHEGPIDLLITDVVMPEMNGRELAHLIHAKYPGAGILYMSGYTEDVIANRGILEPGIFFIEKSEISRDLARTVRHVLSRSTLPTSVIR